MYNVVLIDDQIRFLQQLENIIPWKELGFNLVGKFRSAKKALDYIDNNHIDLVITDIIMPDMTGLDISRILKDSYPHIKIIILSAYGRFDYAQEALHYNVVDFVVKPCSKERLTDVLSSVYNQIDTTNKILFSDAYYTRKNNIFTSIYFQIQNSDLSKKELLENKLSEMNITVDLSACYYKIIVLDETDVNMYLETLRLPSERFIFILSKLIPQETKYIYASVVKDENNNMKILLLSKPGIRADKFSHCTEEYLSILKNIFAETLKTDIKLTFYKIDKSQSNNANKTNQQIEMVNGIIEYIKVNFKNDISINKIAEIKHISVGYMCNIFKRHTNFTISDYINIVRIEEAQKLIEKEEIKTTALAYLVGFNNTSYFYRVFKQITGYTPKEYKEMYKSME